MLRCFVLICLSCIPLSANALTIAEAQVCADRILTAYNKKNYPEEFLAVGAITSRAFGAIYRSFLGSGTQKETADAVALELLRSSFEAPSGQYRYKNLQVDRVERKEKGYQATGEVYIESPKYTGTASFTALVEKTGCQVYQVRIAEIYALDLELRRLLQADPRTTTFFND